MSSNNSKTLTKNKTRILRLVLAAFFLALAEVLPFLTGQIPQIGRMLCPLHFPVLLCGFFCGPLYGLAVGIIAPLLRSLLFGMPVFFPGAVIYAFELGAYGLLSGVLYALLPKKIPYIYVSLIGAMLGGRVVYGIVKFLLLRFTGTVFTWEMFVAGAFAEAIPGILAQIILIPLLVMTLKRFSFVGTE